MTLFLASGLAVLGLYLIAHGSAWFQPPFPWWLEGIIIGRSLLGIAVVAFGISALLGRSWGLTALFLIPWCLIAVTQLPKLRPPSAREPSFTVLSLNASENHFDVEAAEGLRVVADRERLSVIALQEHPVVFLKDLDAYSWTPTLAALARGGIYRTEQPDTFEEGGPTTGRPSSTRLSNPVFSSLEWVEQEQKTLPSSRPQNLRSAFTRAVLTWHGKDVVVYNVHLASYSRERPWRNWRDLLRPAAWQHFFRSFESDLAIRYREATTLRDVLAQETRPFIVLGDLNSAPGQAVYRVLAEGLTDAFSDVGIGPRFTFHARLPFVRIDHVLVSDDWDVIDAQVIREVASDHRAVMARLALTQ